MELQPVKCPSCGKQMPGNVAFCPWDGHALAHAISLTPRSDPLIETPVSEYVVKERIGAGGMGIVYRAVQPLIGKQVAIKVLKAEYAGEAEVVQRLLVEARVVNAIQHRGIIDIFGFGQLPDGRPYVVMELLQGTALSSYIRKRKRLAPDEVVGILDEILAALGAAHRGGVIHRDLKPGNVFLVESSDGQRSVKLLDFGIAKVVQFRPARPLTAQGNILGTPEFMAPEQVRGEKVGPATDLYALGIIAFQLLTGRVPFMGETTQVLVAQVEQKPPTLTSLVPEVPAALERLVLRLLAKDPSKRFQSAEAVRRELGALGAKGATRAMASAASEERTEVYRPDAALTAPAVVRSSGGNTVSLGPKTIEEPMLSAAEEDSRSSTVEETEPVPVEKAAASQADDSDSTAAHATEPAPIEPVSVLKLRKPPRPLWIMGAGMAALVLTTGAVAFAAFHSEPSAQEPITETVALGVPSPAPEDPRPGAPSPSRPQAIDPKARVEPWNQRKVTKAVAPKPAASRPASTPAVAAPSASNRTSYKVLLARIAEAEARMVKVNPLICTNSSPAFAALKDLEKQIQAAPDEDRMKLTAMLDDWEQKFLPKP